MKPSAGLPEIIDGHPRYAATPEQFVSAIQACIAARATFVDGCCGTTPEFIRAAHDARLQKLW